MVAAGSEDAPVLRCLACGGERPVPDGDFEGFNAFLMEHVPCQDAAP